MARHRALYVTTPFIAGDDGTFTRYAPYYYTPRGLESVRMGRDYVDGLGDAGFFTGNHKNRAPLLRRADLPAGPAQGSHPRAEARGLALEQTASIAYTVDDSGDAAAASAIQGAELSSPRATSTGCSSSTPARCPR